MAIYFIQNMANKINNKSPLRYPGGKTRACEKLYNIIDENFDIENISEIVSPFLGGGSFEFYLQNKLQIPIVANDKFKPLYNFWLHAKDKKEHLVNEIKNNKNIDKEKFIDLRKNIIDLDDKLKQAVHYFIINRCSFSGSTLSGSFSQEASEKRFTDSSIDKVNNLDLSNFTIFNEDFTIFLKKKFDKKRLIFADPPYYLEKGSKLYGNNGDMHENFDHEELFKIMSKKKKWIMTYNDCEYIRNLYKDFEIIDVDWKYGMNKTKKSSEIVIICK
jgi:DNA adenine methylase